MRRFLMLSAIAGSLAGLGGIAEAAPVAGALSLGMPVAPQAEAQVESVQYRCGPRCREEMRRREMRRRHYGRRRY